MRHFPLCVHVCLLSYLNPLTLAVYQRAGGLEGTGWWILHLPFGKHQQFVNNIFSDIHFVLSKFFSYLSFLFPRVPRGRDDTGGEALLLGGMPEPAL